MNARELIGKSEGQHLEFKAAEALKNPSKIAREVVAMLNASSGQELGEIWIGLGERDAVAIDPHGVPDADKERSRLRDHLVDTIEPRPTGEEVNVATEYYAPDVLLLRVSVRAAPQRKPFALIKDGGRQYLTRVQDRIAPMTFDELREAWGIRAALPNDEVAARSWLNSQRARAANQINPSGVLWVAMSPINTLTEELRQDVAADLLTDPSRTGLRPHGHTFIRRRDEVRLKSGRVRAGKGSAPWSHLDLHLNGRIDSIVHLMDLAIPSANVPAGPQEIDPLALCEYSTSVVRLAAVIASDFGGGETPPWLTGFAIIKRSGWVLPPSDLVAKERWLRERQAHLGDGVQDIILEPMRFSHTELVESPEACAYRLLAIVFSQFGLSPQQMPRQFDPVTKRLQLD